MSRHRVRRAPREHGEGGLGGADGPALEHIGKNRESQQRREVPTVLEVELLPDGDCVTEKVDPCCT